MSRKKVAKSVKAKKTVRNQVKAPVVNQVAKMEKSFKAAPSQLAAVYRKDLATLKQQDKRLSGELKNALALTKAIENKCMTLAQAKATATLKKRLAAAKKGLSNANAAVKAMSAKAAQLNKQMQTLADKEKMFVALGKELSSFEKNWSSTAKKATKSTVSKKVSKKSAKQQVAKIITSLQENTDTTSNASQETQAVDPVDMNS
jgi:hypothetical protein